MVFSEAVRSGVAARLRPWLASEPELELEIGFLRSNLKARNLSFDSSAINSLVPESSPLVFERVAAREVELAASPWSSPSLVADVRGVDATLTLREPVPKKRPHYKDLVAEERKKLIASIDPQGVLLHEMIESVLVRSLGDKLMSVFPNAILSCSQVRFHEIQIQVHYVDDSHTFVLKTNDLRFGPELVFCSSLFRGLVGSYMSCSKENGLSISCTDFEFVLKENNRIVCATSFMGMHASVRLDNLQPAAFGIHISHIGCKFLPEAIPSVLVILDIASQKEDDGVRSGQELWYIAAQKLGNATTGRRFSLSKVISSAVLWQRYVCAYMLLLRLVGYPSDEILKRKCGRMSANRSFWGSVRDHWRSVNKLEEKLPAEAIARARCVARSNTLSSSRPADWRSATTLLIALLLRILSLILFLWKFLSSICWSVLRISSVMSVLGFTRKTGSSVHISFGVFDDPAAELQFSLYLGELSIMLSPFANNVAAIKRLNKESRIFHMNWPSACLVIKSSCLLYSVDCTTKSLFLAVGELKTSLSCVSELFPMDNDTIPWRNSSFGTKKPVESIDSKIFLWSDPACLHPFSERLPVNDSSIPADDSSTSHLESYMEELWSNWMRINSLYEELDVTHMEQPFVLFEFKSSLVDPYKSSIDGFLRCRFTVGKLNLDLSYSSILMTYLLFRELERYNQLPGKIGRVEDLSNCCTVVEESQKGLHGRIRSFTHRVKIVMLNIVLGKTIQTGALIAGPNIQLMLERDHLFCNSKDENATNFPQINSKSSINVNLAYVELVIWPSLKALPTAPVANSIVNELNEHVWLKELQSAAPLKANRSTSQFFPGCIALSACLRFAGLTAVIDNLEVNQQSHIVGPLSAKFQLSTCRKYVHSLSAPTNVLSMDLTGSIFGAAVFFYMDELFTIFQVTESMLFMSSLTSDSVTLGYSQYFLRRLASVGKKGTKVHMVEPSVSYVAYERMIDEHTQLTVDTSLDLESIDIIFNGSRAKPPMSSAMALNSAISYLSISPAFSGIATEDMLSLLALGVGFSIQSSFVKLFLDGQHTDVLVNFSGIQSVIFDSHSQMSIFNDILQYRTMLNSSLDFLYQFFVPKCSFNLRVGSHQGSVCASEGSIVADFLSTDSDVQPVLGKTYANDRELETESQGSNYISGKVCSLSASTSLAATISYFLVEVEFGNIYMGGYSLCARLTEVYEPSKHKISIFVYDDLQRVKCKAQGGMMFLETLAVSKFVCCCKIYSLLLSNLPSWASTVCSNLLAEDGENLVSEGSASIVTEQSSRATVSHSERKESQLHSIKDLDVDLSQFSLTLAFVDGCGGFQGLTLEVETSLQLLNFRTTILFDLKRLSVSTNNMRNVVPVHSRDPRVPHFRSSKSVALPSQDEIQELVHPPVMKARNMFAHDSDVHPISFSTSRAESSTGSTSSGFSSHDSYILRHLIASVKIEKKNADRDASSVQLSGEWFGTGSVSGFEFILTLSSMQMLLSLFAPLHEIPSENTKQETIKHSDVTHQGRQDNIEHKIPDGAIVAILDLDQRMYMAVEAVDRKYRVVCAYHYSLVGERSLFKVRHHTRWRSEEPCISFLSLYAKTDEGKAMSLNFCPGSDFVEISSSIDKPHSLWRTFPLEPDSFEDDGDDGKSFKISAKSAFYLVNKKNNCGIAFVDGLLEFVKKPGNPFKVKVFSEPLICDVASLAVPNTNIDGTCNLNAEVELSCAERDRLETGVSLPHISITVDKMIFTILHEVFDTNDEVPLIQGCISDVHCVTQIFPSKIRVLSSFKVSGQYFNARRNLWEELVYPITSFVFFRSRFSNQDPAIGYGKMLVRFFFCLKQVDIFINELSVDILLYLAGKLDIMGPYAVRSSAIFPYCCKIENNSRLSLLCRFQNNEDAIVPGKQSASVFLRHLGWEDKLPHIGGVASVSLVKQGAFSTSPITISLQESSIFACKTRMSSFKDSRSLSGPFIVVDVSKSEEGLSLSVSSLLRIYNKSDFSLDLQFRRPQEANGDPAFVTLRSGEVVDESTGVFDAINLSGGSKRALMSLALGNFLLSIKPEISELSEKYGQTVLAKWSEDITSGKSVRISGVFEKLNYNLRRAFGVDSMKSFFSSLSCPVFVDGQHVTDLHFLIHTLGRDVPLQPSDSIHKSDKTMPVALQFQREIFIYPTVQVYNFLQTEINVSLTENQLDNNMENEFGYIGKQAIVACGSSAYFYVNPAMFNFSVTLIAHASKSKPVNSSDWVRRLHKQKTQVHFLDMELEFFPGKYYASLRLLREEKGLLEVAVFTKYRLHNTSEYPLLCTASNQKTLPRSESANSSANLPPEVGCILPSRSMGSWFTKSSKVHISLLNEKTSEAFIDLEVLSGFTELFLEIQDDIRSHRMAAFGVSLQPVCHDLPVPSQIVLFAPRYVISNESTDVIEVRQCYMEDDMDGMTIEAKQRAILQTRKPRKRREINYFDLFVRKHRNVSEDSQTFVQFCTKEIGYEWSGPICASSLGRFFLQFKRQLDMLTDRTQQATSQDGKLKQFASVDVVQETSTIVLHFSKPPNVALPYRIENCLRGVSIMYFQKDSEDTDLLLPGESEQYVWDDLNLPHKLVVRIVDMHVLREINIDKVCSWKPFLKMRQNKGLGLDFSFNKRFSIGGRSFDESFGLRVLKVGYEVYADGLTRVLRICELPDIPKVEKVQRSFASLQFRFSYICVHLLEKKPQNVEEPQLVHTILVMRLGHISIDSLIADRYKYFSATIQSINVDEKWEGASFGSILRRNLLDDATLGKNVLHVIFVLNSTNSNVKQVKYSSIILQPIDLKIDEETLMKLVPFWRTSLADSGAQSQQFYFRHFEIHPIKIITSFRPGNPSIMYSSAQEALRSLLHSVIKVPAINNSVVELNGVLLSHALVTFRELLLKCAQHYSWYILRAIYVAKGSSLLPPPFASIFDDSASSVLDVFFDPSDGSVNLPGLTIGMFKFIRKNMKSKGLSGTKRYFGDLGKTIKTAGSKALFAAVTEISDSIVRGAETNGFNGMVTGFHQGILRLAMEPSVIGLAIMEGGPDRKIKLDRSPGLDELYIEGYLQAMLDVMYKQEYLHVRVIDDQVVLKNLPPNSSLISEIVENVKSFLVSKALLQGDASTYRPLRHLRSESEWRVGPTVITLCEHLFVSFAIRMLRRQTTKFIAEIRRKAKAPGGERGESSSSGSIAKPGRLWAVGRFAVSGMVAYVDGRLCRHIPNPIARRIVSGFLLSFIDRKDDE